MKTSRLLTISQITAIGACQEQVGRFRDLFGESVEVTEALASKHADKFDWDFASKILSVSGKYEYERVCDPARAEYERVCDPAWAEYKRVCDPARAEYERVCGHAWARCYIGDLP